MRPARAGAALLAVGWLALGAPASAQNETQGEDRALDQTIQADQRVAPGRKVLSSGHVDVGPRYVDGEWRLMIHDDQAKAGGGESVWRHPDRTVLRVTEAASARVPDDPAYSFLPSEPGAEVYVVPQTQDQDVVWVGWNTQDPEVMETIDRGVTMRLSGIQGPGGLVVYLQSGNFAEPKVLWDSTGPPKPIWVDVNTHSHANWVFSKPGVYLVQVEISADLIDGSAVSDTRELRFAVGSRASVDDAFAPSWQGSDPGRAGDGSNPLEAAVSKSDGGMSTGVAAALAGAALALAGGLALAVARGNHAKRRARARHAHETTAGDEPPPGTAT